MSDPTPRTTGTPGTPDSPEVEVARKGPSPLLLLLLLVLVAALIWYFFARDRDATAPAVDGAPTTGVEIGDSSEAAREAEAREEAAERERDRASTRDRAPSAPPAPASTEPAPIAAMSPRPDYPAEALRRKEAGRVLLRVDVDTAGTPTNVDFVDRSGSQALDRAAMEAVRGWRFSPATQAGKPVASQVTVPVDFVLPAQD